MLSVPGQVKIWLCLQPADMRRSFDGLAAMVEQVLEQNPLSGHLFLFRNRRADRVKLLYWSGDGLVIAYSARRFFVVESRPRLLARSVPAQESSVPDPQQIYLWSPELPGAPVAITTDAAGEEAAGVSRHPSISTDGRFRGEGDYPLQEHNARIICDFILSKPNISMVESYHPPFARSSVRRTSRI